MSKDPTCFDKVLYIDNVILLHSQEILGLQNKTDEQIFKIQKAEDIVFSLSRDEYEMTNLDKLSTNRVNVYFNHMTNTNILNKAALKSIEKIMGVKECSIEKFHQIAVLNETDSITKQMRNVVAAWKVVHKNLVTDIETKKRKMDVLEMDATLSPAFNKSLKWIKTLQIKRTNDFRESKKSLMDCDDMLLCGIANIVRVDGDSVGGPDGQNSVGSWKRALQPGCKCPEKEDHTCQGPSDEAHGTIFSLD
jgi:hypothetical protein